MLLPFSRGGLRRPAMERLMLSLFMVLLFPPLIFAHPGRTDSNGCHVCRSNCAKWDVEKGVKHCHQKNDISPQTITRASKSIGITKKAYGKSWPFTVTSGVLECRRAHDIILANKRKVYALNGNASGSKKYRGLFKIWKENPEIPGTRIPVGDIISRGLKLCR